MPYRICMLPSAVVPTSPPDTVPELVFSYEPKPGQENVYPGRRLRLDTIFENVPTGDSYVVVDSEGIPVDFSPVGVNPYVHEVDTYTGVSVFFEDVTSLEGTEVARAGDVWSIVRVSDGAVLSSVTFPAPLTTAELFSSHMELSCDLGGTYPEFRLNNWIDSADVDGTYVVLDGAGDPVDLTPAQANPFSHLRGQPSMAYGYVSSSLTAIEGNEVGYLGQNWLLKHVESDTTISTALVPTCNFTPAVYTLSLTCDADIAGNILASVSILSAAPSGQYFVVSRFGFRVSGFAGFETGAYDHVQGSGNHVAEFSTPSASEFGGSWDIGYTTDDGTTYLPSTLVPNCVPPVPTFDAHMEIGCNAGAVVSPEFWFNNWVGGADPSGTYVVRDGNGNDVNLSPAQSNPYVHVQYGTLVAYGNASSFFPALAGNEASYAGQTWTLRHLETNTVISSVAIPVCAPPPPTFDSYLSLTCDFGSASPSFVVNRVVALGDPSGTYVVRDGNGVAPSFTPYETNPYVHIQDNDVASINQPTTSLEGTSVDEAAYIGQTWTLVHVETNTVISSVAVPAC